jgi:hypothetical protein
MAIRAIPGLNVNVLEEKAQQIEILENSWRNHVTVFQCLCTTTVLCVLDIRQSPYDNSVGRTRMIL